MRQFTLFPHAVQPVEIRLFTIKTGLGSSLDLFIDALSSPLLIMATRVSQISDLTGIMLGTNSLNMQNIG
jgi:hypothetical protein